MDARNSIALLFALVILIAIPFFLHASCEGAYKPEGWGTFWIGPISTTLPYVFLALLFLAHCFDRKSKSLTPAYCGAVTAWLCMMAFTVFLIFQTPGPRVTSTMGIAVGLTPFFYIPFLVLPYAAGSIVGWLWTKKESQQ